MSPLNLSATEAAALDRLLDAYLSIPDESDPGVPDLQRVKNKVAQLPHDHSVYEQWFANPVGRAW